MMNAALSQRRSIAMQAPAGASAPPSGKSSSGALGGSSQPASRRRTASQRRPETVRIGVVSDTHGYLDPHVLEIFAGVDHVIHAGDVMDADILTRLAGIAPLTAVRGNLDDDLEADLAREETGEVRSVTFVVSHKPRRLLKRLAAGKIAVGDPPRQPNLVVWGHLHTPTAEWVDGQLLLNPGTASSPDEEDDGPTVAIVETTARGLAVQFVPLQRRPQDDGEQST